MDPIPKNWYTETELRKGTTTFPLMIDSFLLTFAFESKYPSVDQALDAIKIKIFEDCTLSVHTQYRDEGNSWRLGSNEDTIERGC